MLFTLLKQVIYIKNFFSSLNKSRLILSFLNITSDGVVIVDRDGRILGINKKFEELHGWSENEIIGEILPMTPENCKAQVFELYERIIQGEEYNGHEVIKLRKDGSSFYANVTISAMRDDSGEVVAFVGVERDITEKKMAEAQLKESEERYRLLVENSPEPIMIFQDNIITFVNPAAVILIGASKPEELIGENAIRFFHPDDLDILLCEINQLLTSNQPSSILDKRLIKMDGEIVHIEVKAVPFPFLGNRSVQLLFRDITERKKAVFELAQRELEYSRVLKLSPEPIVLHRNAIVTFVNDAALKLFNVKTTDELIGRSIFEFSSPSYHETLKQRLNRVIETDGFMEFTSLELQRLDGTVLDVEVSSIYIDKHVGAPVIQTVIRDMSERKKSEDLIRRAEKLSIVGELAAGIAHEIRNPLTTLKGFLQLLKSKGTAYVDIMLVEIDRINQIVNEFMSMAKPHADKFVETDLKELIENIIFMMQPQANLYNVQVVFCLNTLDSRVFCEPNHLKQVFINLIKNSIEAMPSGGTISLKVIAKDTSFLQIVLSDEGSGIHNEHIANLGKPFFTTKEKGTGLGLMVCFKIIEAHRGHLDIQSELGKGTTIKITLPFLTNRF
ncbi:PAS domain-containing sensor histidine kinase [Bacillus sp. FJAT-28004]|uniref:PAS domain-containing sensor histidine kinase n=1 Tax=Bacillus sp. FJAT-28004 TaxID=1679165 RepID=UPI0006B5FA2B|nr:PAS domain-containing sensor histidine kinase [Bacillus sp. FJAT-28004]